MLYKRPDSKNYWYEFTFNGEHIRESAKTPDKAAAGNIEAAHRLRLANGLAGIHERKVAPTLRDFITKDFEPWARKRYSARKTGTWRCWYEPQIKFLLGYQPLAKMRLDEITSRDVEMLIANRIKEGWAVSSANNTVRILRRMLSRAVAWGTIEKSCKVITESGENHRGRVLTFTEQERYLLMAPTLLYRVVLILAETGMRPSELYAMRWESVKWALSRHGIMTVQGGKTSAARRDLPLTARVRELLEVMYLEAGKPAHGQLFPADTSEGHITLSTLKKPHNAVFTEMAKSADPVGRFILYDLRHTFLTRLGESGVDVYTLMRIAGHSNIKMAMRYVHIRQESVVAAMDRMYNPEIAHSGNGFVPRGTLQ